MKCHLFVKYKHCRYTSAELEKKQVQEPRGSVSVPGERGRGWGMVLGDSPVSAERQAFF